MKRSHLTIAFYLLVVFASGVVVGAFGHLYTVKAGKLEPVAPPRNPDEWRQRYVQDLRTRLNLEPSQVQQLNVILDQTREKFKAAKERHRPEMKAIHDEQVSAVRAMLNPSQQAEYDRYWAEKERKKSELEKKTKP